MGEVIDITRRLSWKRIADVLARGGSIVCHPSNAELLEYFKDFPVTTSTLLPEGKAYAVDFKAIRKAMMDTFHEPVVLGIDWARKP